MLAVCNDAQNRKPQQPLQTFASAVILRVVIDSDFESHKRISLSSPDILHNTARHSLLQSSTTTCCCCCCCRYYYYYIHLTAFSPGQPG